MSEKFELTPVKHPSPWTLQLPTLHKLYKVITYKRIRSGIISTSVFPFVVIIPTMETSFKVIKQVALIKT